MRLTRRERIKLLLGSLLDATAPGRGEADVRAVPESRPPPRSGIWQEGSYIELWCQLDRLREDGYSKIHRHLLAQYAGGSGRVQKRYVERGIDLLMRRMPRNVYVPTDVSERAGFTPGDARAAQRPRRREAA